VASNFNLDEILAPRFKQVFSNCQWYYDKTASAMKKHNGKHGDVVDNGNGTQHEQPEWRVAVIHRKQDDMMLL